MSSVSVVQSSYLEFHLPLSSAPEVLTTNNPSTASTEAATIVHAGRLLQRLLAIVYGATREAESDEQEEE